MNKPSKKVFEGKHKSQMFDEYETFMDMVESGLEDYEIAAELGVEEELISDVKKELYGDIV